MNNIVLVGTVKGNYKVIVNNEKHKLLEFTLAVPKPFKNAEGNYDADVIPIKVWSNVVNNLDYDIADQELVCVKGRIGSFCYQNKTGTQVYYPEVIAERLTNLSAS